MGRLTTICHTPLSLHGDHTLRHACLECQGILHFYRDTFTNTQSDNVLDHILANIHMHDMDLSV